MSHEGLEWRLADQTLILAGAVLVFAGLILAFLALLLPSFRHGKVGSQGGAVIIIGPFPIVFGSNPQITRALIVLAILLVAILIGFFLIQSAP